jgi:gliding motility-associated-like protein
MLPLTFQAQTFTATGGAIPDNGASLTCFPITVSGVGVINGTYGLSQVCINLTHPFTDEIGVWLKAPNGLTVPLTLGNGGGANFVNTCFNMTATSFIFDIANTNPYTGSFIPEEPLGWVNDGQNANGTWFICAQDVSANDVGTLGSFSLTFSNTPAPPLSCNGNLIATNTCDLATPICNLNGYCGTTSEVYSVNTWPELTAAFSCGTISNNSFIKFVATAATVNLSVNVFNSTTNDGIQMMVFGGGCGSGAVTSFGCSNLLPPGINTFTATGLTPGNTYYIMVDGFVGGAGLDVCDYIINVTSGVNVLSITPTSASICPGGNVSLTASGGNGVYTWSPATNLNTTTGATVISTPTGPITYTVTSGAVGGLNCPFTKTVAVSISSLPATPTASVTVQPNCTIPTGTIVVTAPTGAGLEYSINGTTYQASPTFTGLVPNNYNVTVRNTTTSCISAATALTVNPIPAPPVAPTASVTVQPTCALPTGTIVVTAPLGANLQYSINGTTYQASVSFAGLAPNNYNVTVRNTSTNCVSTATALTVNAVPNLAAPTASVTQQPTCALPNSGIIVVTAPTGANFEYSINGTTYQASTSFTGLTANNYNVTVRNTTTSCVSVATPLTVNAPPGAPAAPTATATQQPTCPLPTGTITITAPTGANLEYSIDGTTYQAGLIFAGLTPSSYNVTVRNTVSNCVSTATAVVINPPTGGPAAPTATVTAQPTCATPTGTITITAPTGANLEYSIDGTTYQAGLVFATLAPGPYSVTVRIVASTCVSTATNLTVNPVPVPPTAPTATVTIQPTCAIATGTIIVTAPIGANLQYSVNGTTYQAGLVFSGLTPGPYTVTVRNTTTNCTSTGTALTVNNAPPGLVPPTASTTIQPNCLLPFGTIVVTAPVGAGLEYSINGTAYQSGLIFTNVNPGNYNVTVRNLSISCTSNPTVVTVNPLPAKSPNPVVVSPEEYCLNETPVPLTAVGTNLLWYTAATGGIPSPIAPTPSTSMVGPTTYYVSQVALPLCESNRVPIVVEVYELPTADAGMDKLIFAGQNITLSGTVSTNTVSYLWTPILVSNTLAPAVAPLTETIYSLTATTVDGCKATDDVTIKVLKEIIVPNVFSPNGDNINDKWMLKNIEQYPSASVEIFNRYGQQIFRSSGYPKPWDGTIAGKPLPVGTYYYIITTGQKNVDVLKGSISIIR